MQQDICAVYDMKAGNYLAPFFVRNEAIAIRWFRGMIGDVEHDFHKHAEDFALCHLGKFDDEKPEFEINPGGPRYIAQGMHVKLDLIRQAANVVNMNGLKETR